MFVFENQTYKDGVSPRKQMLKESFAKDTKTLNTFRPAPRPNFITRADHRFEKQGTN
jgi:hypothetical protein